MSTRESSLRSARVAPDPTVNGAVNARGSERKTRGATKALRKACPVCQRSFFCVSDTDFTFHVALCLDTREDSDQRQWERQLLDAGKNEKSLAISHEKHEAEQELSRAKPKKQHSMLTDKSTNGAANDASGPKYSIEEGNYSTVVKNIYLARTSSGENENVERNTHDEVLLTSVVDEQSESLAGIIFRGEMKWHAQICVEGVFLRIGTYSNANDASVAYEAALNCLRQNISHSRLKELPQHHLLDILKSAAYASIGSKVKKRKTVTKKCVRRDSSFPTKKQLDEDMGMGNRRRKLPGRINASDLHHHHLSLEPDRGCNNELLHQLKRNDGDGNHEFDSDFTSSPEALSEQVNTTGEATNYLRDSVCDYGYIEGVAEEGSSVHHLRQPSILSFDKSKGCEEQMSDEIGLAQKKIDLTRANGNLGSPSVSQQSASTASSLSVWDDEKSSTLSLDDQTSSRIQQDDKTLTLKEKTAEWKRQIFPMKPSPISRPKKKCMSSPTSTAYKRSRRASKKVWNCPICNKEFSLNSTTEENRNKHVYQCDGVLISSQDCSPKKTAEISSHFTTEIKYRCSVELSSSQNRLDFTDVTSCDNSSQTRTFTSKERAKIQSNNNRDKHSDCHEKEMLEDIGQDSNVQEGRRVRSQKAFHVECPICRRHFNKNKTSEAIINRHVIQCSNAFERHQESSDKIETERLKAALEDDSVSYGSSSDDSDDDDDPCE